MSTRRPERSAALFALLLALAGTPQYAPALESDSEQPIRISADQAVRDEKKGFTVYRGNVRVVQGSIRIEADAVTIYHEREEADRIVAVGKPARMQQRPNPEKGTVHASALTIEYFKREERVHLQDQAYIEQDGSTVTGDTIDYFIREERVRADAARSRSGNRVEVVIPAEQLQPAEDDSGQTDGG